MCPANSKKYMNRFMYWPNGYMKSSAKKAENATRKRSRYNAEKKGKVKPFDGKEVDHKAWVSAGNWEWNLRVISKTTNRKLWVKKAIATRKARLAKGWKY